MKHKIFCLLFLGLALCGGVIKATNDGTPYAWAKIVPFYERYVNFELIEVKEETITSPNQNDLKLTKTNDERDENGTGYVYYCYGRKFGYCD